MELTVTAVVLALAAVLVQTPPGRTASAEAARADRAGVAQLVTTDLYMLQFDALPVVEWNLSVALPSASIEPIALRVDALEANHGSAEIRFPVAGDWTLRITARTTDVDQATVAVR